MSEDKDKPKLTKNGKKCTKFKKGAPSPNPNGAPKGPRKGLTNNEIMESLRKGTPDALSAIRTSITSDKASEAGKLKAAVAWMGTLMKLEELEIKKILAEAKTELAPTPDFTENNSINPTGPTVSRMALVGKKNP